MSKARKIKRREKPPVRVRLLNGVEVLPTLYTGRVNGQNFKLMAGYCEKDGEIVKNSVGEPLPFKSIGELVWK
mgnify:CR=1 FL=1